MNASGWGRLLGFPFQPGQSSTTGTGVPTNGIKGFAPSAIFHNVKGSTGSLFYINIGTYDSSNWLNIDGAVNAVSTLGVIGVAAGYKIARGTTALDGSNPTPVTTGLSTVVAATLTLHDAGAPGVGTCLITNLTTNWATGALAVDAWKPTSNSDPTLVASSGTETFSWIAVGT
jgi:hypothetical protein